MKTLALLFAASALFAQGAFAKTLSCTLQSGKKTATNKLDLNKLPKDPAQSDGVYDLSFMLEASCDRASCDVEATFLSQKIEDETGHMSFRIKKSDSGRVHGEPLTNAPDRRAYDFYCYVN